MDEKTFREEYLQIPMVSGYPSLMEIDNFPPGTTFKMSREHYYSHKDWWMDRYILYSPAQETAYKLDPDDPRDRQLIERYTNTNEETIWLI